MHESQRTLTFVGVAAASLVVALFAAPSAPKPPATFDQVGEDFFQNFTEPSEAKTLQVIAYDSDKAESRLFGVEFKDGLWRIPSRHNYPADGKDRLAKLAASIIGLKRESLAGQRAAEHPEFEVVDPLDQTSESLKRGQRITLKNAGGDVLADYIIGKQVPSRAGYYYIRRADENATYIAKIQLDLSTKFADWIEPDLLKVDSMKLLGIEIDNYSIDYEKESIVSRDRSQITRKNGSDPWKLDGLDDTKEELNQDEVRKLVDGLDNMKIVGVRPKPPSLSRDLKMGEGLQLDPLVRSDLGQKGFMFARTQSGGMQLVAKEGEVVAKTDQGVVYALYFGEIFSGTEEEIEFGFAKDSATEQPADAEKTDEAADTDGKQKSRYLFVTVQFDDSLIPGKPAEPVMPQEPTAPADLPQSPTEGPADALISENAGPQAEYARQKAIYDTTIAGFDSAKAKYEADLAAFQGKVAEGEAQVKELNARFADWFYVISAGSFENLRQGRDTLVKPKGEPAAAQPPNFPPQ